MKSAQQLCFRTICFGGNKSVAVKKMEFHKKKDTPANFFGFLPSGPFWR